MKEPLFSVVIPVYNTEDYLVDAIESIVGQTVGFEENIQLILVNDGSKDGSGAICESYASKYPENVLYIDKENGGVGSARNVGLVHAEGKYVNFLDSDDKWSLDAFACFNDFFVRNPAVGIATARHEFFGARSGKHQLSYKYEKDGIVDILTLIDRPQLTFSNAVISREYFSNIVFDEDLNVSEDFLAMNTILLDVRFYGVLKTPVYWYRKRGNGTSAIDVSNTKKSWYSQTLRLCDETLFHLSEKRYGYVIPYFQYIVMYDLQWRLKSLFDSPLDIDETNGYKDACIRLLKRISPEVIFSQRNMNKVQKLAVYALREGISYEEVLSRLVYMRGKLYVLDGKGAIASYLWTMKSEFVATLHFLEVKNSKLVLEGSLHTSIPKEKIHLVAKVNGKSYQSQWIDRPDTDVDTFFVEGCRSQVGFKFELPLKSFSIESAIMGISYPLKFKYANTFPLSDVACAYTMKNGFSVSVSGSSFTVKRRNPSWVLKREYLFESKNKVADRSIFKLRRQVVLARLKKRSERIWLVSDRPHMAGDNGEALFSYLQSHPVPGVKVYFAIEESSPDFKRMSEIGPVVPYWSERHKVLLLEAEKNISSIADVFALNPFGDNFKYVKDLMNAEFVFLQHGVTKDDMSSWLKRWKKDIKLLCCASPREQKSIVENPKYGYGNDVAMLTGFARHDKLVAQREIGNARKILIAPTWRKAIAGPVIEGTGKREPNPNFKSTDYFRFYDRLLNDEEIRSVATQKGFSVHFLLHPALLSNLGDFSSSYAEIQTEYNYAEEFMTSSIMITDYSSVAFDFAVLKKPLLYAQFDKEEFYQSQWERGYFDYERDGFGPVCMDYSSLKNQLLSLMEDAQMEKRYVERVDQFFGPLDGHACERIVEALV